MRRTLLVAAAFLVFAASAVAQRVYDVNGRHVQLFPDRDHAAEQAKAGFARSGSNLLYHNGPVIHGVSVVAIYWGSEWGTGGSPSLLSTKITGFFQNFGTTGEYNVITQYYDGGGNIQPGSIGTTAFYDSSAPPTNVTDSAVQAEVASYIDNHQGGAGSASTIYEVFLPSTSYASFGSSDSCGGPNLQFCAYHSNFNHNGVNIKYSSMPYPSCSGCQWPGWTVDLNFDHFACHETREAVTDPDGSAWYDRRGNEADDKCAWSPNLFTDGGFGYQYEWSNAAGGCVQKQ